MPITETIAWPGKEWKWYWMRCKPRPRGKWRVMFVELVENDGIEFVRPLGDRNCYSRPICEGWQAEFVPAHPPPEEWL